MNLNLLQPEVQDYIAKNWNVDVLKLLLQKPIFKNVPQKDLVAQIECKQKAKNKLSTWFGTKNIVYPNKLNIEQTSSEITAQYKSELVKGKKLVDLTGGFGVDSFYFSKSFDSVHHCELNTELSVVAAHNFAVLKAQNINTIEGDGLSWLEDSNEKFDCIYLDPSRRSDVKGKVFQLKDYQPDFVNKLDLLFSKSNTILVKTAPLLDINQGLTLLGFVKEVHVVAIKNEVKELLWLLEKDFKGEVTITAVNILNEKRQLFDFHPSDEKKAIAEFSAPKKYLYEPNAAILKSGAFKLIGVQKGLEKLAKHSHLYTSDHLMEFPGRVFEIEKTIQYNKLNVRNLDIYKANITTRNFHMSVAEIRKQIKIKEGGDIYLFFTMNTLESKIIIQAKKVDSTRVQPNQF